MSLEAQAHIASVRAGAKVQVSNVRAKPSPTLLLIEECDKGNPGSHSQEVSKFTMNPQLN